MKNFVPGTIVLEGPTVAVRSVAKIQNIVHGLAPTQMRAGDSSKEKKTGMSNIIP
jgi:hypothetical protein